MGQLDPQARAVAKRLAAWRERTAANEDRPVGQVLQDPPLLELAKRHPRHADALGQIRGIHPSFIKRRGAELLEAITAGLGGPADPARGKARPLGLERRAADRAGRGAAARPRDGGRPGLRADRLAQRPRADHRGGAPVGARARRAHAARAGGASSSAPTWSRCCPGASPWRSAAAAGSSCTRSTVSEPPARSTRGFSNLAADGHRRRTARPIPSCWPAPGTSTRSSTARAAPASSACSTRRSRAARSSPRPTPASSRSLDARRPARGDARARRDHGAGRPRRQLTRCCEFTTDTADPARGALLQKVQERGTTLETQLLFFELEWAALEDDQAEALLTAAPTSSSARTTCAAPAATGRTCSPSRGEGDGREEPRLERRLGAAVRRADLRGPRQRRRRGGPAGHRAQQPAQP